MSELDLIIIGIAVCLGAVVKSVTEWASTHRAPHHLTFVSPETGIAILAIPSIVQNAGIVGTNWHARTETRGLTSFCLAGIGVVIGTLSLGVVPEHITLIALNVTIIPGSTSVRTPTTTFRKQKSAYCRLQLESSLGSPRWICVSGLSRCRMASRATASKRCIRISIATAFGLIGTTQTITLAVNGHLRAECSCH